MNKQFIEDTNLFKQEWGDGDAFYEHYEGFHIRVILLETLWMNAMHRTYSCLAIARSIGELEHGKQKTIAEVSNIAEILAICNVIGKPVNQ